jgi:hypothetical protein
MAKVEADPAVESERNRVVEWRIESLQRAGYDAESALLIGLDRSIDLHFAIDLLRHGCPKDTALQILF